MKPRTLAAAAVLLLSAAVVCAALSGGATRYLLICAALTTASAALPWGSREAVTAPAVRTFDPNVVYILRGTGGTGLPWHKPVTSWNIPIGSPPAELPDNPG